MNPAPVRRSLAVSRFALVAALVAGPAAPASDSARVSLRLRLEPGQVLRFELRQTARLLDGLDPGREVRFDEVRLVLSWRVETVDEAGIATVNQAIERVQVRVDAGPGSVAYDSGDGRAEGPGVAGLADHFGRATRGGSRLRIDPSGRVVEARPSRAMLLSADGSPFGPATGGGAFAAPDELRAWIAQVLAPLPAEPALVGDDWREVLDVPAGGSRVALSGDYTLAAVDAREARVAANFTVAARPDGPAAFELLGASGRGDYRMDLSAGLPTRSTVDQEFRILVDPAGRRRERRLALQLTLTRLHADR